MPPNNHNNSIQYLAWWLIITPTVYIMVHYMIISGISEGELLGIIVSAAVSFIGFAILLYRTMNPIVNPFKMLLSLDDIEYAHEGERRLVDKITIPIKLKSNILLQIQPKYPTLIREYQFFFNPKRCKKGRALKTVIELTDTKDIGLSTWYPTGSVKMYKLRDAIGGIGGRYEQDYLKGKEDKLYLGVTILAHKPWKGYLVFYSQRKDGNRGYAFLRVETKV